MTVSNALATFWVALGGALGSVARFWISGWVANRWDSTVETVAEGPRATLNEFRAFLRRGSPSAFVQRLDDKWETATGEFERFGVRYL